MRRKLSLDLFRLGDEGRFVIEHGPRLFGVSWKVKRAATCAICLEASGICQLVMVLIRKRECSIQTTNSLRGPELYTRISRLFSLHLPSPITLHSSSLNFQPLQPSLTPTHTLHFQHQTTYISLQFNSQHHHHRHFTLRRLSTETLPDPVEDAS